MNEVDRAYFSALCSSGVLQFRSAAEPLYKYLRAVLYILGLPLVEGNYETRTEHCTIEVTYRSPIGARLNTYTPNYQGKVCAVTRIEHAVGEPWIER